MFAFIITGLGINYNYVFSRKIDKFITDLKIKSNLAFMKSINREFYFESF